MHQSTHNSHTLLLTNAEVPREAGSLLRQSHLLQKLQSTLTQSLFILLLTPALWQKNIFQHIQLIQQIKALKNIAHIICAPDISLCSRQLADILAGKINTAAVCGKQSRNHMQHSCLTAAAGTVKQQSFTLFQLQRWYRNACRNFSHRRVKCFTQILDFQ